MPTDQRVRAALHHARPAPRQVDLHEGESTVTSILTIVPNPKLTFDASPLVLDGEKAAMTLKDIKVNGTSVLEGQGVEVGPMTLTVPGSLLFPDGADAAPAIVEVTVTEQPEKNTALDGLYKSGGNYCTQMEAQGFRRFAYHMDRPDVMSEYTCTVSASEAYPVLLSNGNLVEEGTLEGGRHFTKWHDPHLKPSYLFAVVAGSTLGRISSEFTTASGRKVDLHVYAEADDLDQCHHALQSIKDAMRWDEQVYGREYDLDIFNIVAVSDFNMGAMENKSLNVFNTKYVLATPQTATDSDFDHVAGVVAHEEFHNWTGNRVTCRDWFQLTLKEGLTVFRDQEFSADTSSRAVKRIEDATIIRARQFAEDAGPMAHPVRPNSVVAMNNFYSVTVYNKGAEIIRMAATILGPAAFRKATDAYFARHDGTGITCEDWINALEDALVDHTGGRVPWVPNTPPEWADIMKVNEGKWEGPGKSAAAGHDADGTWGGVKPLTDRSAGPLAQFRMWYCNAGTPKVTYRGEWDAASGKYTLHFSQTMPATADAPELEDGQKPPMHIPIRVGLLGPDGKDLPLHPAPGTAASGGVQDEEYGTGLAGTLSGVGSADAQPGSGDVFGKGNVILHLTQAHQSFTFEDLGGSVADAIKAANAAVDSAVTPLPTLTPEQAAACPIVPSVFRGWSAPVHVDVDAAAGGPAALGPDGAPSTAPGAAELQARAEADSLFRMAYDADSFNRWDASNELSVSVILDAADTIDTPAAKPRLFDAFVAAMRSLIADPTADPSTVAMTLALPPLSVLLGEASRRHPLGSVDPERVAKAKAAMRQALAGACREELTALWHKTCGALKDPEGRGEYEYTTDNTSKGMRKLRAAVLITLAAPHTGSAGAGGAGAASEPTAAGGGAGEDTLDAPAAAVALVRHATNMTDADAALNVLAGLPSGNAHRAEGLAVFYERFGHHDLIKDKWLRAQSTFGTAGDVQALLQHEAFSWTQPNKMYSTIGALGFGNPAGFHAKDGSGYDVLKDMVLRVDPANPQVCARLAGAFTSATQLFPEQRAVLMERVDELLAIGAAPHDGAPGLSKDTFEVLSKVATSCAAKTAKEAAASS